MRKFAVASMLAARAKRKSQKRNLADQKAKQESAKRPEQQVHGADTGPQSNANRADLKKS